MFLTCYISHVLRNAWQFHILNWKNFLQSNLEENFIIFLDILKYSWLKNVLPQSKHGPFLLPFIFCNGIDYGWSFYISLWPISQAKEPALILGCSTQLLILYGKPYFLCLLGNQNQQIFQLSLWGVGTLQHYQPSPWKTITSEEPI